jgi:hypothetical protein
MAKISDITNSIQEDNVSLQGCLYDFLKVGIYPKKSITDIMIIEING